MSFAITTGQVERREKDVTRRLGWGFLRAGDCVRACEKCMGLKKGEKVRVLDIIEVITTRWEPLRRMTDEPEYGREECRREGFPEMTPEQFVAMFCASHGGCTPDHEVNRIEYRYVEERHAA